MANTQNQMRELSADEIALLDKYVTPDALTSWKRRFDHARTQAMIWRSYQQMRPVETGLYTDRYGYPNNSVRPFHHQTNSYWAKIFLNHLAAIDREITELEREYVRGRITQALTGENSLAPFFFEMRMFNAVDRSVARRVSFAEAHGKQHDINVETTDSCFSIECKSLRSEIQFKGAWFHLSQLNQTMIKKHSQDIETGRAYIAVHIIQPSELKNEAVRRSTAKILAALLHAPIKFQHAHMRLVSWEGGWSSFEQAADNIWKKFEQTNKFDPSRHLVYFMSRRYEIVKPCIFFFVEVEQKKLGDRVKEAAEEAAIQLRGQSNPCLALNLERTQMDAGPTRASPWQGRAQETANECWSALSSTRHFGRFKQVCVYQNFPPMPGRPQSSWIVDQSHMDCRIGGSLVLETSLFPIAAHRRTWV